LRMITNNLSVAIIAGGKSNRFGEPKSWAKFRGKRLIEYAIDLGRQLSDEVFIINGKSLDYSHLGIATIEDIIVDCGPIGGLYSALCHTSAEFVATMPVDMPLLPPEIYEVLFSKIIADRPVVARSGSGLEPLVAIWPQNALSVVEEFIQQKKYSLRNPLQKLQAIEVNIPAEMERFKEEYFLNINYKEDLESTILPLQKAV